MLIVPHLPTTKETQKKKVLIENRKSVLVIRGVLELYK